MMKREIIKNRDRKTKTISILYMNTALYRKHHRNEIAIESAMDQTRSGSEGLRDCKVGN